MDETRTHASCATSTMDTVRAWNLSASLARANKTISLTARWRYKTTNRYEPLHSFAAPHTQARQLLSGRLEKNSQFCEFGLRHFNVNFFSKSFAMGKSSLDFFDKSFQ